MEFETLKQAVERVKKELAIQESQLKMYENCIERCNYIVEVGAYTLARGDNNNAEYVKKLTPTQWDKESAIKNAEQLKKANVNKHIRVVDKITWYKEQIETKKQLLEYFAKIAE